MKNALPATIAGGFSTAFGLTKAAFALHLLAATTVLGVAIGPYSFVVLGAFDFCIGIAFAVAGAFLVLRRHWALNFERRWWLVLIGYEIGRALGIADSQWNTVGASYVVTKLLLLACLVVAWACLRLQATEEYVRGSEAKKSA